MSPREESVSEYICDVLCVSSQVFIRDEVYQFVEIGSLTVVSVVDLGVFHLRRAVSPLTSVFIRGTVCFSSIFIRDALSVLFL